MKISSVCLWVLFFWLSALSLSALDLKSPPQGGVFDPGQVLDEEFKRDIEYTISYEAKYRQFEIFVIIFEEEPSQGAEILAKQAGESWSKGGYWAVIYQIGLDSYPECIAGGTLIQQLSADEVRRTIRTARNTSLLVSSPQSRLEELVTNLADSFGFFYIKAKHSYEELVRKSDEEYAAKEKKKGLLKIMLLWSLPFLLGLALLGYLLWKKYLRKMKPMAFPETSPRHRLSAPFSGGGDVLVKYGKRN